MNSALMAKQRKRSLNRGNRRECQVLVSELFHLASQSLAALQCWLGVSCKRTDVPSDMHEEFKCLGDCLEQISWAVAELRELTEHQESCHLEIVRPGVEFHELFEELQPVAESCGIRLQLKAAQSGAVRLPKGQSRTIFFRLIESTLALSPAPAAIKITVEDRPEAVNVKVTSCRKDVGNTRSAIPPGNRSRVQLSRRILLCSLSNVISAGGGQVHELHGANRESVIVTMPRVDC